MREYAGPAGQDVELRMTATAYKGDSAYVDRRILTLPYERTVYPSPTGKIVARVIYQYDWGGADPWYDPYFTGQAPSVNHDTQGYPPGSSSGAAT